MRSIWKGTISFGLVALPVDLFAATEDHGPGLHLVHAKDGGRVRHRRVCELDGREIGPEETARGWEAPDGRTVVLQDADLDALPLPSKRIIEVLGFVGTADVDPLLYARPYWVGAHGPGAQRPYAVLVEALARSGRLAVCKVALRSRERLAILRPRNGILICHTLRWPEEVRQPGDLSSPVPTTTRELELAELLMTEMSGVDVGSLHDDYAEALNVLVDTLAAGGKAVLPPEPEPPVDLMAALEASVRTARRARNETE
ncbi:non-homologous end joining protein Ku [Streptomyces halobius]|uniref:Non-homologous end joining protein Ku n=1 Tax=Streptomyces halobius TaxID=2879846 RepID=A0ABY4M0Q9_9ACTN|nr:Ku protein [Streptomyces halobius]